LTADRPELTDYDQDASSARFSALETDPGQTLATLEALRATHLRIYRSVTPAEAQRTGVHARWGEMTLADIVMIQAGHNRLHAQQIREALANDSST
ncbi:MAG: DinB family protein, partial [Actinomycetota bacterium]